MLWNGDFSTSFEMHFFANGYSQPVTAGNGGSAVFVAPSSRLATAADTKDSTEVHAEVAVCTNNGDDGFDVVGHTVAVAANDVPITSTAASTHIPTIVTETVSHTPSLKETCLAWNKAALNAATNTVVTGSSVTPDETSAETAVGPNVDNDGNLKPDLTMHVVVRGAEPGYVATPAIFVTLALCLLEERHR